MHLIKYPISLLLVLLPVYSMAVTDYCYQYTPQTAPSPFPENYGVPWDPFTLENDVLMKASCISSRSFLALLGVHDNNHYFYEKGYYYHKGWKEFFYQGNTKDGQYYVGSAYANVPTPKNLTKKGLWFVAYICKWTGPETKWKCGCRDQNCKMPDELVQGEVQTGGFWNFQYVAAPCLGSNSETCILLEQLRDTKYLGISRNDASDIQLSDYIEDNKDRIQVLLSQIDYGRAIDDYLHRRQSYNIDTEQALFEGLRSAVEFVDWTNKIISFLPATSVISSVATNSLSVLGIMFTAAVVYDRAIKVLSKKEIPSVLTAYIANRYKGHSAQRAWNLLSAAYQPILVLISDLKNISLEELAIWFENAYTAYRLVHYEDSEAVRRSIGVAIACDAIQCQ